jgi:hypothetical protein
MIDREKNAAVVLVRKALAAGYTVSVFDGEEYSVKRSSDLVEIKRELHATDEEWLTFRRADGSRVGTAFLVYGNAPDGSELVCDHTDNAEMQALVGY